MKLVLNCKGHNKFSLKLLLLCFSLILGTLLVGCDASSSGDSTPAEPDPPTLDVSVNNILKVGCPVLKSHLSVRDTDGNIVDNLKLDNLTILEDNQEIEGDTVTLAEGFPQPFAFAIMMDYSSSLFNPTIPEVEPQMKEAAKFLIDLIADPEKDFDFLAGIIKFAKKAKFMNGYDPNNPQNPYGDYSADHINILKPAIDTPPPIRDVEDPPNSGNVIDEGIQTETNIFGLLELVIENIAALNQNQTGNNLRKLAIILLTDGEDNINETNLENVIRSANENSIPIFLMGVTKDLSSPHPEIDITRIATETGGTYFTLSNAQSIVENHQAIYNKIVTIIENQYEITYDSTATPSQDLNQLSITVNIGDDFGTGIGSFSAYE